MTDQPASKDLMTAIRSGKPVIMDGAMGTELDRRGTSIASKDWVAATLGSPDNLIKIHRSYAEAGAQLHIANSFATARHVLAEVGLAGRFEALNRDAVSLCRDAVETRTSGPAWIAGSISTYMIGSDRGRLPPPETLEDNAASQAAVLSAAGCHMIVLEMIHDVDSSRCLMRAAAATGLPVSVGLTVVFGEDGRAELRGLKTGGTGHQLRLEDALPQIIAEMKDDYPWILTVMHSDLDETDAALETVQKHWSGPIGIYPNAGHFTDGYGWDHSSVCTPEEFADRASGWADAGASFIGGCCGIGPEHIRALAQKFRPGH